MKRWEAATWTGRPEAELTGREQIKSLESLALAPAIPRDFANFTLRARSGSNAQSIRGSASSASTAATVQLFKLGRRSRNDRPTKASPILVAFGARFLSLSRTY